MTTEIMSFADALAEAGEDPKPHLLLGNGFSIAWRPELFEYRALLEAADFSGLSLDGKRLFDVLSTTDFERVIQALRTASTLVALYESTDWGLSARLQVDAEGVKDELARVIADKHPDLPNVISSDEYASSTAFLRHFERIYSLNYDFLLYWVAMNSAGRVPADDGFRDDVDQPDATFVTWDSTGRSLSQRLFYLHGALHLFDEGDRLTKFTWIRTQVRLIDQVRAALDRNAFPLVVTEGSSDEKFAKINHHAYLSHAFRSFASIGGSLFIFGHSLAENDMHVLRLIPNSNTIRKLFVSVRESSRSETQDRAENLLAMRPTGLLGLAVRYFDADSAQVWR